MAPEVTTTVFVGTSLDGFIARANGEFDFLDAGGNEPHGFEEFYSTVDALVMGRKTYETALGFGAWPYGSKPVFVLSTQAVAPAPRGAMVEHLAGDPAAVVSGSPPAGCGICTWTAGSPSSASSSPGSSTGS